MSFYSLRQPSVFKFINIYFVQKRKWWTSCCLALDIIDADWERRPEFVYSEHFSQFSDLWGQIQISFDPFYNIAFHHIYTITWGVEVPTYRGRLVLCSHCEFSDFCSVFLEPSFEISFGFCNILGFFFAYGASCGIHYICVDTLLVVQIICRFFQ